MLSYFVGVPKMRLWALLLIIFTVTLGSSLGIAAPIVQYSQGFEVNDVWGDAPTDPNRVPSGTNGITSKAGSFHGEALSGDFTRWGGYNSVFPANGYTTSVDFYLNLAGGYANDTRFDWSSAISNTGGTHRRDFIFNGGFYNDAGPVGSGPRFCFSASNNSPGNPRNPSRNPISITASGWYTLKHTFLPGVGNVLVVKMEVLDASGTVLGTWYLSDSSDIIGTTVGGNRYGWLVASAFPYLAVDNSERVDLDLATNSTIVVTPSNLQNWVTQTGTCGGLNTSSAQFVPGIAVPPAGIGSFNMKTGSNGDAFYIYRNTVLDGAQSINLPP